MRDEYAAVFQVTLLLAEMLKDSCNRLIKAANDQEKDGPVYEWAQETSVDVEWILSDAETAREREP